MNYHKVPNQSKICEENKLSLKERGLYSVICEFINIPKWELNLTHIAKEAGISLSTCRLLVNSIIKKGWLTREKVYAPNGIQGTNFVYKLAHPDLQSEKTDQKYITKVESRDSQITKPVTEIQVDKIQVDEIQVDEIQVDEIQVDESNVNNNNYTIKNNINNTNSNEIVSKYIWKSLEEFEDFEDFVLTKKSQELNKAKPQVQGIFKNIEKRISKNEATFSDLKLLKEWRQDSMPKEKIINKKKVNDNTKEIIENAIKSGEIICDRTNSEGIYGVQISSFEFMELNEWLKSRNEEKMPVNEKALELIRAFKNKYS